MSSVVMMAKRPVAGRVKTRLGQAIGHTTAARISQLWITHLVDRLGESGHRRVVAASPDNECELMRTQISTPANDAGSAPANDAGSGVAKGKDWHWRGQGDGDLGWRMRNQFRTEMNAVMDTGGKTSRNVDGTDSVDPQTDPPDWHRGKSKVVIIGSDLPDISADDLELAWLHLETSDLVLGPATDGGYWLIGLAGPWRDAYENLFKDLPWSTPQLFSETIRRAQQSGLTYQSIEVREDIDNLDSLNRWLESAKDSDLGKSVKHRLTSSTS